MSRIQGVAIGIVKEVESGGGSLGRVKVCFPWMSDDNRTFWARVATTFAGNGRGTWFMPEKEDEVLVAFEHGDVQNGYVIGQLWSRKRKPPLTDDSIDEKVRRIQTVADHRLDFDDRPGKERIYVESHGDHKFEMQDFSPPHVKVETKGQQSILMEDSPGKITIKTAGQPGGAIEITVGDPAIQVKADPSEMILIKAGGNRIKIDATGITVTTGGVLNVTANVANVTASGLLNVTAPTAVFSGTLIATAIVSSTYSPGVGNLI